MRRIKRFLSQRFPSLRRWYGTFRYHAYPYLVQWRISRGLRRLRGKDTIKVAFLVVLDSVFQFRKLFELMSGEDGFSTAIVVIPQTNREKSFCDKQYQTTLQNLKKEYADKVIGVVHNGECQSLIGDYDICITANSYDGLTHKYYGIEYLSANGVPTICANYGFDGGTVYAQTYFKMRNLAFLWRYYAGTNWMRDGLVNSLKVLKFFSRVVIAGIPKMDYLPCIKKNVRERKRILICPHHSIDEIKFANLINLSNFTRYYDLILKLPERYPQIDWIFRPHPFLMETMIDCAGWTKEQADDYIAKFCSFANAEYKPNGDCFDMFVNSDAMIQDCSSFLAEYHLTGHPQCYVLKSVDHIPTQFDWWGQELLGHTYKAYSEQDIIDFIDNVVIAGNDPMKEERMKFAKEKLMFNYPHASEAILADIKKALGRE